MTQSKYLCNIYILPEISSYFSEDIFDNLRDDINTFSNYDNPLMICGGLNARTSNLQDFMSDIDKHNIHDSVTIQTELQFRRIHLEEATIQRLTLPLPSVLVPTPFAMWGVGWTPMLSQNPFPHELEIL